MFLFDNVDYVTASDSFIISSDSESLIQPICLKYWCISQQNNWLLLWVIESFIQPINSKLRLIQKPCIFLHIYTYFDLHSTYFLFIAFLNRLKQIDFCQNLLQCLH